MRSFLSIVAPPALCLGILAGISWENTRHRKPADAVPYHAAARQAVLDWPRSAGAWQNVRDAELPLAAIQLLKPNGYFYRVYTRPKTGQARVAGEGHQVGVLVVQCSDPEDMSGHYPPNCYPRTGSPIEYEARRTWTVPGMDKPIEGMEYRFAQGSFNRHKPVVYNFFVLPGRGIVPDMDEVRKATGDHQRRHFGAAQIQVLFEERDLDPAERDEAFIQLMSAGVVPLKTLDPKGL